MSSPPPRQCAAVLLINERGEVLLVRQAYGRQFWGLPGGIVDPGETPLGAAVREAREEVGVEVALEGVVGAYLLQGGGWPDIQAYVFAGRVLAGEPRLAAPQELSALAWCPLGEWPSPLLPDALAALEDLRAGRTGVVRTVQRHVSLHGVPL
ncbi:mutator protein MutT [Deinococcus sp. HSC-46F16]|uniref:NUDIX hydrolase n=1 Tax=Deinococcus sp. HSC-46F16 TaxID=2910968 RepID=UPI00209FD8BD|nr:NUDIX hydrolase [Deinococcus sp. HSC-46F16]MCP2015691.1 mutator protein MutT [Deinococcus sp. HSC-46F16]